MTQQELQNLIHQTVCDTFSFYKAETIETFDALINSMCLPTHEKTEALQETLFNYTMATSETICIAMAKILTSAGILNISEADG